MKRGRANENYTLADHQAWQYLHGVYVRPFAFRLSHLCCKKNIKKLCKYMYKLYKKPDMHPYPRIWKSFAKRKDDPNISFTQDKKSKPDEHTSAGGAPRVYLQHPFARRKKHEREMKPNGKLRGVQGLANSRLGWGGAHSRAWTRTKPSTNSRVASLCLHMRLLGTFA